jgi:hypothetical protein
MTNVGKTLGEVFNLKSLQVEIIVCAALDERIRLRSARSKRRSYRMLRSDKTFDPLEKRGCGLICHGTVLASEELVQG